MSLNYNYHTIGIIGTGSYGEIFRGYNHKTGEPIAIKKFKYQQGELGIPADILKEIVILKSLDHDNIITIDDVVCEQENIFIIINLMNCDLKHYMNVVHPQPFTMIEIKKILREILLGIEYIHDSNIIHRDMKPQNVLINYQNFDEIEIKISDFGLSKLCSILKKPNTQNISILYF